MEARLVPVNAFIALCTHGDIWPAVLADAGYRLKGLEVGITTEAGNAVVDVIAFNENRNVLIPAEGKSGPNIESDQARCYQAVDGPTLVTSASVTVTATSDLRVDPVYVCLEEHTERVLTGLEIAGVEFPVLSVAVASVAHHGTDFLDADLQAGFREPVAVPGGPPRLVPADHDSDDVEIEKLVLPTLVAELSHRRSPVTVPALTERAFEYLPLYGTAARNRLMQRVDAAARRIADADPASFRYLPRTGRRDQAAIEFVRTPEEVDRRGRTQSYQAITRAGLRARGRQPRPPSPGQGAFDALITELDKEPVTPDSDDDDDE